MRRWLVFVPAVVFWILPGSIPGQEVVGLDGPSRIEAPGHYRLERDLVVDEGPVFEIRADHVVLDLGGHRVELKKRDYGQVIILADGRDDITIRNGRLVGGDFGIYLKGPGGRFHIQNVVIERQRRVGIDIHGEPERPVAAAVLDTRIHSVGYYGIRVSHMDNGRLEGNNVEASGDYSIYVRHSRNTVLRANTVMISNVGILVSNSDNVLLEENVVSLNAFGIYLYRCTGNVLRQNKVFQNNYDIFEYHSTSTEIGSS